MGKVQARVAGRRKTSWSAEIPFGEPEELEGIFARLMAENSFHSRPHSVSIELEKPLAQIRTLRGLPPVRKAALQELISAGVSRYFRRNGKPLVVAARWLSRRRGQETVAHAAAAEEPLIDALLRGARAARLRVDAIKPADSSDGLTLLSPAERRRRKRAELLATRKLAWVAALLCGIAAGSRVLRFDLEQRRVGRELGELAKPNAAIVQLRRELTTASRMVQTVEQAERNRGVNLTRLASLTAALPDSAYLTSLSFDDSAGTLSGVAPQATEVLAALDRAPAVVSPRLTGPAVREVIDGKERERFTVSFVLRRTR
jgi:hypothetical protein